MNHQKDLKNTVTLKENDLNNNLLDQKSAIKFYLKETKIVRKILEEKYRNLKEVSSLWPQKKYWSKISDCLGLEIENIIMKYRDDPSKCPYSCEACKHISIKFAIEEWIEIADLMLDYD